ncbi:MAG: superoxide dismutase [Acidobacteria bacterium]|nr:superoxide dismutase [Acidobacteriota bacterium]
MRHETRLLGAVLILLTLVLVGATARAQMAQTSAVAVLTPTEGNDLQGTVTFTQTPGGVRVQANLTGLTGTEHGFHVHQYGDCSASDGTSAGGHFNPHGADHAGPFAASRHVGDLGNSEATYDRVDTQLAFEGESSIIGRAVIVHGGTDDLSSQPSGAAGPRIACGVIGIAADTE